MFCHASTVTAAFRDPLYFFSGLAAYTNGGRYVIACSFLGGTLVASLPHSGFLVALGSRSPCVFLARLFFPRFVMPVEVKEGWLASNSCSTPLLLSFATLHAQLTLVATVTKIKIFL